MPAGRSVCSRTACQHGRRLVGVGGADHVEAGDGAQGGEVLDRLVGGAVLAEADGVVGPDVGDRRCHQRGEPDGAAHVVGEGQEGAAEDAGAAVDGDAVHDRAHGVLADAEVQHPAGERVALPEPRGAVVRAGTTAHPRSWCCWTRPGRPSRPRAPGCVSAMALITPPLALRVAIPFSSAGNVGRRSAQPRRQGPGLQPLVEVDVGGRLARPRVVRRLPLGARGLAALDAWRVCSMTAGGDVEGLRSGSKPRIFLVAATSSSPRALPWALKVFWRLGAGQPMIVRSWMKLGLSVTRWASRIASWRAGTSSRYRAVAMAAVGPVDVLDVPAVGLVALLDVLVERDVGVVLDRDLVVVVDQDQVAELLGAGDRGRLAGSCPPRGRRRWPSRR